MRSFTIAVLAVVALAVVANASEEEECVIGTSMNELGTSLEPCAGQNTNIASITAQGTTHTIMVEGSSVKFSRDIVSTAAGSEDWIIPDLGLTGGDRVLYDGRPALAVDSAGMIHAAVALESGDIKVGAFASGSWLGAWSRVAAPTGTACGAPAIGVSRHDVIVVACTGDDETLYTAYRADWTASFSTFASSNARFMQAPTIDRVGDLLMIAGIGKDKTGQIVWEYDSGSTTSVSWNNAESIGGSLVCAPTTLIDSNDRFLHVFALGNYALDGVSVDNSLYVSSYDIDDDAWISWVRVGAEDTMFLASPQAIESPASGKTVLVGLPTDYTDAGLKVRIEDSSNPNWSGYGSGFSSLSIAGRTFSRNAILARPSDSVDEIVMLIVDSSNTFNMLKIEPGAARRRSGFLKEKVTVPTLTDAELSSGAFDVVEPENMLIYYGWPSVVNGARDVNTAYAEFAPYKSIIFGTGLEWRSHPDHEKFREIVALLNADGVHRTLWGYVTPGTVTVGTNFDMDTLKESADAWKDVGLHGVFFDEAGYDYGTSMERRNELIDHVHGNGQPVFVNAWFPEHVFGDSVEETWNPNGEKSHLGQGSWGSDWYLWESFMIALDAPDSAGHIFEKAEKLRQYKEQYGVKIAGAPVADLDDTYSLEWDTWCKEFATMYGFDYYGWSGPLWGAVDSKFTYHAIPKSDVLQDGEFFVTKTATVQEYDGRTIMTRMTNRGNEILTDLTVPEARVAELETTLSDDEKAFRCQTSAMAYTADPNAWCFQYKASVKGAFDDSAFNHNIVFENTLRALDMEERTIVKYEQSGGHGHNPGLIDAANDPHKYVNNVVDDSLDQSVKDPIVQPPVVQPPVVQPPVVQPPKVNPIVQPVQPGLDLSGYGKCYAESGCLGAALVAGYPTFKDCSQTAIDNYAPGSCSWQKAGGECQPCVTKVTP